MNTRFSIVLVDMDSDKAEALALAAENDLHARERMMSRFDTEGSLWDLNRCAGQNAIQPPQELWEILLSCREYWRRTHGAFDITLRPLHHLWREHLERGEEPSREDIEYAREQSGFARLRFDEVAQTVRFESKGMSIDLGGFGKGYALEHLAASLRAQGVERAFLSFGESSITVLGSHPHGPSWPVGIANMFHPAETVHTFQLHNASLSSSGTAPSNRMGDLRPSRQIQPFGQIVDPRNGRPIEGYRTMSVASPSGIEAEVLSTALLVTPAQDRPQLLAEFSNISAVETVYYSGAEDFVPNIEWKYGF